MSPRFVKARSAAVVAALAALGAACGSSSTHAASNAAARGSGPVVLTSQSSTYGTYLTTSNGFALYTYTADLPGGPGCSGACLQYWPPLLLPPGVAQAIGGTGVTGLGTFDRGNRVQVTFHGLPLYTYVSDKHSGQVTGQNVTDSGGRWLLATLTSAANAAPNPATSAPATTTAPVAISPTTAAPVTAAPATRPAVTSPPVTRPSVTSPPMTTPPRTAPPTTRPAPVTTAPTTPPTTASPGLPSY